MKLYSKTIQRCYDIYSKVRLKSKHVEWRNICPPTIGENEVITNANHKHRSEMNLNH